MSKFNPTKRQRELAANPEAMEVLFGEIAERNPEMIRSIPRVTDDKNQPNDLFSHLLDHRIILVTGQVDDDMADLVVAQLLYLETKDASAEVNMFINSPGGSVSAGLAIYDTMRRIGPPIHTYCMGMAASMGSVLLTAGDKRSALPNSQIMIHQMSGGTGDRATLERIKQTAAHMDRYYDRMMRIYEIHTGVSKETLKPIMGLQDAYLDAELAQKMNLIDEVLSAAKNPEKEAKFAYKFPEPEETVEQLTAHFNEMSQPYFVKAVEEAAAAKAELAERQASGGASNDNTDLRADKTVPATSFSQGGKGPG